MKTFALTAAALLIASGTAFAGSDNFRSDSAYQPPVTQSYQGANVDRNDNVDHSYTSSIGSQNAGQDQASKPNQIQPQFEH